MDPKRSSSKSKSEKKTPKKKRENEASKPCFTEPSKPVKDGFNNTQSSFLNTEPALAEVNREEEYAKEKEACALDYLRELSEEESSNLGVSAKIAQLDADLDIIESSGKLTPFLDTAKRGSISAIQSQSQKSTTGPSNNVNIRIVKEHKPIPVKHEDLSKRDHAKIIRTEPNELVVAKKKSSSCQFLYPPKDPLIKVRYGIHVLDDSNLHRRSSSIHERVTHVVTEGDQDFTGITQGNKLKEEEILGNMNDLQAPPSFQARRLVGSNYTHILKEMMDYREMRTVKDIKSFYGDNANSYQDLLVKKGAVRKALFHHQKKMSAGPSSLLYGPENIVLVGHSFSGAKSHREFEQILEKDMENRENSKKVVETKPDENQNKILPYKDDVLRGIRTVSSARTSRQNSRRNSATDKQELEKTKENGNASNHAESPKVRNSHNQSQSRNESPSTVLDKEGKEAQDMKAGIWLNKAKKKIINLQVPDKESLVQDKFSDKFLISGKPRVGREETCKENTAFLEKVSKLYNLKMGNASSQKSREAGNRNPLNDTPDFQKGMLNLKDLNVHKSQKLSTSVTRNSSLNDVLAKIDMKNFGGKAPKLKTILNILSKELNPSRISSPSRDVMKKLAVDNRPLLPIPSTKKGLENFHVSVKGSKTSRVPRAEKI